MLNNSNKRTRRTKKELQHRKQIAMVVGILLLVILIALGVLKMISMWKYKSCNNNYISISQYKSLKIPKTQADEVTDDLVDFSLAQYLQNENLKQYDTQSQIKEGDTVCLSYTGRYNGSSFRNSDVKGLVITLGNGSIDENFEKQILGHKPEEIFDVKMTLPDNYSDNFVAGKEVTFNVQVEYILKSVEIPNVVTDDFIQQHTKYSSLAQYKQHIKKDLKTKAKLQAEQTNRKKAIEVLLKHTKVKKYPNEELKEIENILIVNDNSNALYSGVSESEYKNNMGYKTEEDYNAHIKALAQEQLKERLAVDAIAKANALEVPNTFTEKEEAKLARESGFSTVEEMKAKMVRNEIRLTIKKFYVADYLLKHSK